MSGGLVGYRNLIDSAALSLGSGSAYTQFPLENLKTRQLSKICRVHGIVGAGTAALTIIADRGAGALDVAVGVGALLGLNRDNAAPGPVSVSVRTSPDGLTYPTDLGSVVSSAVDNGVPALPGAVILPLSGTAQRFLRIAATWLVPSGVTDADIGRLWIGPAIDFAQGVEGDWEQDFVDTGRVDASDDSQYYESKKSRTRALRISATMSSKEAFGFDDGDTVALDVPSIQGLQMEAGCTGEVVAVPRASAGQLWARRLAIYGHCDPNERPTIKKLSGDHYATRFTIVEER